MDATTSYERFVEEKEGFGDLILKLDELKKIYTEYYDLGFKQGRAIVGQGLNHNIKLIHKFISIEITGRCGRGLEVKMQLPYLVKFKSVAFHNGIVDGILESATATLDKVGIKNG